MAEAPVLKLIPVNRIAPSRHQARKNFDEDGLKGLAASIEKEGLLEPVMVRAVPAPQGADGEWYELVYGERRFRACKLLGRDAIEAIITTVASEAASAAKGLVENLQREGINPIEEAEGYAHLNQLDPGYWTQEQIAGVIGRNQGYISQSIRILQLPESIKENIRRLILSCSHALELMRLPNAGLQEKAAEAIVKDDLSIKETRELIGKMLENTTNTPKTQAVDGSGHARLTPSPQTGEGGDEGVKSHPSGFRFNKVGKDIHILGVFPGTTTLPDLSKGLEDAYQKWQSNPPKDKKCPSPLMGEDARRAGEGEKRPSPQPSPASGEGVVKSAQPNQPATGKGKDGVGAGFSPRDVVTNSSAYNDVIANSKAVKQSSLPNMDAIKKMAEAMGGLKGGAPNMAGFMAVQLQASLAVMNQRLADPNVSEEEKSKLKEGIQKLQEKIDELKGKGS